MRVKEGVVMMALALAFIAVGAQAESFGSGANAFTLDFVNIGHAGNAADSSGYGAVADGYLIGTHEITINQFAKARAADGRIGDGDENPYVIGVNGAASSTSWREAAKFANWLTTGDAYTGAYQFDGAGVLTAVDRAAAVSTHGTVYVLPTEDEWYKAAYLKSDGSGYTSYATGDSTPGIEIDANYGGATGAYSAPWDVGTGNMENNGTYDMGGNVTERTESAYDGILNSMVEHHTIRGGSFNGNAGSLQSSTRFAHTPTDESVGVGFRVAAIPEPASLVMIGAMGGLGLFLRRRFTV